MARAGGSGPIEAGEAATRQEIEIGGNKMGEDKFAEGFQLGKNIGVELTNLNQAVQQLSTRVQNIELAVNGGRIGMSMRQGLVGQVESLQKSLDELKKELKEKNKKSK